MDSEEAHDGQVLSEAQSSNPAMSIIGAEDEEFENDLEPMVDDQSSHFNSIELLKVRPAHLLVFLQHVILQFDCAVVLCYLHADLFKNLNAKETKKQFVDFYNTFLDRGAILRVQIPHHVSYDLDRTRPDQIGEDVQKRYVQDIQNHLAPEVLHQLDDFRQKRTMGMTLNEQGLVEVESYQPTDRVSLEMKERTVAESLLDKMSEMHPISGADEEKYSSILGAVVSYMKHLGVKTKAAEGKKRGFFRKKIPGMRVKSEESTKSKQRGGFPNILSETARWIGGGNVEIKAAKLENEGDKEKVTQERKGSSGPAQSARSVAPEPTPASFPYRKPGATVASGSLQGSEGSEGSGVSISVTSSPDSSYSEMGLTSSRSDPQSISEGGEVSPVGIAGSLSVWEPSPANEPTPEENQDKDSVDSGATPTEGSLPCPASGPAFPQEEVEPRVQELEQDLPNWKEQAPPEALSNLSKKETKRQEVINELIVTEHAHARMLTVLQTVFSRPLGRDMIMTHEELETVFPGLDEIIEVHYAFYDNLKKLHQENNFIVKSIGATLLHMFNGADGEWFQKLTARFCSRQSYALDQIKSKQKKDQRFNAFIQEAESKPRCRRLQLKDIIPIEMQRLTKYPLLLENIAKSTEDSAERESIQQAAECCRKILNHVNEEVKKMENMLTLKDYQRRLDTSGLKPCNDLYAEYKSIDLTSKTMIYEGALTWKVTKEKALDVQCVLLGDLLVLLQKQDDKMVLKCQSKSSTSVQEGKQMLSPIIKLDSAFLREVATDRKAFYVIFTWESGAQIYELVAHSVVERKNWTELIKSVVDELKQSGSTSTDRKRNSLSPVGGGLLYSPTTLQAPLSPTENGGLPLKNNSVEQGKETLSEEKGGDSSQMLMDYLLANGFDVIAHSNSPQEKVANQALEDVMSLKRLLGGSVSQSEDSVSDGENGGTEPKQHQESDGCQTQEEGANMEGRMEGEQGGGEDGETKEGVDGRISAPLELSAERMEEVRSKLQSLEQQLKQLQSVEEEYHRLQEVLSKRTLSGFSFQ
ncbi:rho guanine nucleotide exchange factor 1b isoform X1 [Megalops cyprinoides]|uniref:rho guanine nucleotide exchange factor 1b isoform X1 n=2 Tax=Megalops cyprinoides TaxID=118141 RepID=UPI001863E3EB|nr:rho guanine nucleotide exchange factor 1b isoform X1 [Megalops cyprinoides]XP_036394335.1 rho guanine nucleotide exchange factor 1b isoform X1 [Megalops cyprinoides]